MGIVCDQKTGWLLVSRGPLATIKMLIVAYTPGSGRRPPGRSSQVAFDGGSRGPCPGAREQCFAAESGADRVSDRRNLPGPAPWPRWGDPEHAGGTLTAPMSRDRPADRLIALLRIPGHAPNLPPGDDRLEALRSARRYLGVSLAPGSHSKCWFPGPSHSNEEGRAHCRLGTRGNAGQAEKPLG